MKKLICIILLVLIFSCDKKGMFVSEINSLGEKLSAELDIINKETLILGKNVEKVLKENKDVNVFELDSDYAFFEDIAYYKRNIGDGSACFFSGAVPLLFSDKKRIKQLEDADRYLIESYNKSKIITATWIFSSRNLVKVYPPHDVISTYPPGLDYTVAPFYKSMTYEENPDKEMKWDNNGEPQVGMAGEGWTIAKHYPIYLDNDNIMDFMVSVQTLFSEIIYNYIEFDTNRVLLLSKELNIIGGSRALKKKIDFNEIEKYNYLSQMKTNSFVQEQFNLGHRDQPKILIELNKKILNGDNNFYLDHDSKTYYIHYTKIENPAMYIVGFLKE